MQISCPCSVSTVAAARRRVGGGNIQPAGSADTGSAMLAVLVMLTIMVAFVLANSLTMKHLKRELRLIEQRQLRKYELAPVAELDRVEMDPLQTIGLCT